jgi:hypothetical protein
MSPLELRTQLETVARRLGVIVAFEPFEPGAVRRGGLCKVRGQTRILVDAAASIVDQVATLENALARFDLEGIFVPPLLRARLEGKRRNAEALPQRTVKSRRSARLAGSSTPTPSMPSPSAAPPSRLPAESPRKSRGPSLRKARKA